MRIALLPSLLIAFLLTGPTASLRAQTYFYIEQIGVLPAAPTDQDAVQLLLTGNLSNTGVTIDSVSAHVNGFTVGLAVAAISAGGLDVLVPHTESVDLGTLPAGDYTITVAGPGIQVSAPESQHHFTVSGAGGPSPCDSLVLESFAWAPFSDTALLVHVLNPGGFGFDYPGFMLLADNGDTLGRESVNFFGIAGESYDLLTIPTGTTMPASPFDATLQLWTGFYDSLACSWDLPVDLCPLDSCTEVLADIRNFGSGLTTGDFMYTVREAGTEVASGTFTLTADQQYDQDTLCLPPGNYLLEIVPEQGPTGGQPTFGVSMANVIPGPRAPVVWTTLSAVAFELYGHCIDIPQGIGQQPSGPTMDVLPSADGITVLRSDGHPLGDLKVLDARGRKVASVREAAFRHRFSTAGWAPGLYVVRASGPQGRMLSAKCLVE